MTTPQKKRTSGAVSALPPATLPVAPQRHAPPDGPSMDGFFQGFGGATAKRGGNYIAPGDYILCIERLVGQLGRNPTKNQGDHMFIAEFSVVRVLSYFPGQRMSPPQDGEWLFPPSADEGARLSWVLNVTRRRDMALSDMKALFLVIRQTIEPGFSENSITAEDWDATLTAAIEGDGTLCQGYLVRCVAQPSFTKDKKPFTRMLWLPAEDSARAAPSEDSNDDGPPTEGYPDSDDDSDDD